MTTTDTPVAPDAADLGPRAGGAPWERGVAVVAGAAVSLGVGEVFDGASRSIPSLVIAAGEWFRDAVPGDFAKRAVDAFGANDKPALVIGTTLVVLVTAYWVGRLSARVTWLPAATFAVFGLFGGWLSARSPLSSTGSSWVAALVSAGIGYTVAWFLLGRLSAPLRAARTPAGPVTEYPTNPAYARRSFLGWSAGATAVAVGAAGIGKRLRDADTIAGARVEAAGDLAAATGAGTVDGEIAAPISLDIETFDNIGGLADYLTPNDEFYRIDTALRVPQIDADSWTLSIDGMVDEPYELTFADVLDMTLENHVATLSCVSNEVGGNLVGNAMWTGVPLATLLDRAGVQAEATQIFGRSVDDFTAGFPVEAAFDGRNAMLAIAQNGEPLPAAHGFPARLVVPGLYGYVSAVKWIKSITLTTFDQDEGYWVPRGWSALGPVKTQSRVDVPRNGQALDPGTTAIAGVAWAPTRGIARVEVSIDDGDWQTAELAGTVSVETWVQWKLAWEATPGEHTIRVRATDDTGVTQSPDKVPVAPNGAEGFHQVSVRIG